ncbi:hypothetical protein ACFQZ8_10350, partial [Micromonospora azadirachtae]
YRATVLPGASPDCTRTLTGAQARVVAGEGVTCLKNAQVVGTVSVKPGASLVVSDSSITGTLSATGAQAVQIFGSTVNGATHISGTTRDVTIAGSTFNGSVSLAQNVQVSANDRYSRLAGAYGPILVGSRINGSLSCAGNSAAVKDFGAPNTVNGAKGGDCAAL